MRTVIEIADAVRRGHLTATEVLEECLAAIERTNPELNAFVVVDPDLARAAAGAVDDQVKAGRDPGLLAGVPFGVKDLEDCAGLPTSKGSLLWKGRPPVAADSIQVARLRAAGAVPVGKTAAPEFGTVHFTSTRAWGTTRNPWDPARTSGGSSGGSAAAVAAGMVPFCTASDGGGSTRIPAAFSGLVGFKASFGRIPDVPLKDSMTAVAGCLTTTVADAARHLDVAAGPDDRDRTSLPAPKVRYERAIDGLFVDGLRAAWSPDLGFAVVDPEIQGLAEAAAMALIDTADLDLIERPVRLTDPVRTWLTSGTLDLWQNLEPGMWPERADEFNGITRAMLQRSEDATAPSIARNMAHRDRLQADVAEVFAHVDVLLTPTTAVPAFAAAGPIPTAINGQEVAPGMTVPFTMLANLCWNPAISVPAGLTSGGLPAGLQIIGRRHHDEVVLRLARIFEGARPWPRHAPRAD
jgi:aspartyl-tRNA(Asn)/glutamyl-tRNA(Gln) amidotransferase subunit A